MDSPYLVLDARFEAMIDGDARPERIHTGATWTEGPVWFADLDMLLFNDIPNHTTFRWTPTGGVSVFRADSRFANGNTRDREGRLVTCEHGTRSVVRTEPDGRRTVLADRFEGRRLNSPNDVVVKADGSVWFTDPTYGIMSDREGFQAEPEQPVRGVYRIDGASGAVTRVVDDFLQPNGLAFSPDETTLYVADSGASHVADAPRHIRAFRVSDDGRLADGRVFAAIDMGLPDGLRVATDGTVWTSAGDGVHALAPDGTLLGKILIEGPVANLTFGGPERSTLFVTASASVWRVPVRATGVLRP